MNKKKFTKLLALYLPYLVIGLAATNLGEAWRLAEGKELGDKIVSLMGTLPAAFANPLPSLHPLDILVGICCGAGLRLAVYLKSKNAKKYRHGMEYGSARWGTPADIAPFIAPKFEDNIILTKTERLMMSNRPPDPKNARNKNVLVVGGSGSGKTRYFIKPNLLQCTSKSHPVSFVVTDPKGGLIQECGLALLKNGYKIRTMNTIIFHKSMRYNPFAYIHEEKDILKLVTTLMTNTKGEGQGGDPFWDKAERLLLTSLIAYALMKNKIIGICPNCGANVVEREKGWFCENRECRFVLWKDNAFFKRLGKRLDAHVADKLLRDGRVRLKDCKSAKGKTYNATVLLGTEADGRSKFSLEFEGGC